MDVIDIEDLGRKSQFFGFGHFSVSVVVDGIKYNKNYQLGQMLS